VLADYDGIAFLDVSGDIPEYWPRRGSCGLGGEVAGRIGDVHWPKSWWPRDDGADSPIRRMYPNLRPTLRQRLQADWYRRFDWPHEKPRRYARY
jgi:hypothetical protein